MFFFVSCVSHAFASVHCCLVVTCWVRADLLALVGDVYCIFVTFPLGILGQVWYLIVSFPDFCRLSYFDISWQWSASTYKYLQQTTVSNYVPQVWNQIRFDIHVTFLLQPKSSSRQHILFFSCVRNHFMWIIYQTIALLDVTNIVVCSSCYWCFEGFSDNVPLKPPKNSNSLNQKGCTHWSSCHLIPLSWW